MRILLAAVFALASGRGFCGRRARLQRQRRLQPARHQGLPGEKLRRGDSLFQDQLAYAEEAEDAKQQLVALNNLALAHLKKGEPLFARAWLEAGGRQPSTKTDKATTFNRGEVDQAVAALPARPAIGGTYQAYAGAGQWQSVELKAKGKNKYSFSIFAIRLGNQWREWGPAGIGEIEGEI